MNIHSSKNNNAGSTKIEPKSNQINSIKKRPFIISKLEQYFCFGHHTRCYTSVVHTFVF